MMMSSKLYEQKEIGSGLATHEMEHIMPRKEIDGTRLEEEISLEL